MSIDPDKIGYSSTWDIDQLVTEPTSVAVTTGNNSVLTITGSPSLPVIQAQFKPDGDSKWYEEGTSSTDGTVDNLFTFYTYISGGALHAVVQSNGTVRYFRWQDKIDY